MSLFVVERRWLFASRTLEVCHKKVPTAKDATKNATLFDPKGVSPKLWVD
jgi:hypothetical protein